uniref:Uncharacterized protein n=1 Tax=Haemonchus contortus TaxID=6289 RepID=A0A7I4Y6I1_HAECO
MVRVLRLTQDDSGWSVGGGSAETDRCLLHTRTLYPANILRLHTGCAVIGNPCNPFRALSTTAMLFLNGFPFWPCSGYFPFNSQLSIQPACVVVVVVVSSSGFDNEDRG